MDIDKLKELISENLTQRVIAEKLDCSQSTVKHWLKKFKLKTINTAKYEHIKVSKDEKYCPKCEEIKLRTEFFKTNKDGDMLQSYCKKCNVQNVVDRGKRKKLKMLKYMGNQCVDCGLKATEINGCVFDFHHLDPNEKDFNLSTVRGKIFDEVVKKELDKCVLLCSNCHRIRHNTTE